MAAGTRNRYPDEKLFGDVIWRGSSGSPPRQARPGKLGSGGVCGRRGSLLVLGRVRGVDPSREHCFLG